MRIRPIWVKPLAGGSGPSSTPALRDRHQRGAMTNFLLCSRIIRGADCANPVLLAAALPLVLPVVRCNPSRYSMRSRASS